MDNGSKLVTIKTDFYSYLCLQMEVLDVLLVLCVFVVVPVRSEGEEACETLPSEIHITKGGQSLWIHC